MTEAVKLTKHQAGYLRRLSVSERWYEIGDSTLMAMARRGLVRADDPIGTKRRYEITEKGRTALSSLSR